MTKSSACAGGGEIGSEAALVADIGVVAGALQRVLQRVEHFGAHAHGFGDARGADRHDHEFLEVDRIVGVHAAIDDVHHRHRQQRRLRPADIAIERLALRAAPRPWRWPSTRREWRWRRAASCSAVPSRSRKSWSSPRWSAASKPVSALADLAIDRFDRLPHALAAVARAAVSELMRLMRPGRGAGGHRGAAMLAALQAPRRPRPSGCHGCREFPGRGWLRWRSCEGPFQIVGPLSLGGREAEGVYVCGMVGD